MFGLGAKPFRDEQLGELKRGGGVWRGELVLEGSTVPLEVEGGRERPEAEALELARGVVRQYAAWRPRIAAALWEHYEPYGAGGGEPVIDVHAGVWAHARLVRVSVVRFERVLTVELAYETDWDEEHTLGARLRGGELVELNGSV